MISHTEFKPTNVNSGTLEEKVQAMNSRIRAFNLFFEAFQPKLNVIYYPGSSIDTSPSNTEGFKDRRIIYVDQEKEVIEVLQKEGCEAYFEDAKNFNPGEVNLLLFLNFYAEKPLKHVVKDGFVICNGYRRETLGKMLEENDFKLVGVFTDGNQTLRTDEETLRINSQTPNPSKRNAENLFVFRKK